MLSIKAIKLLVQNLRPNFSQVKNKYDFKLCHSRFHTASKTFVRHKKYLDQDRFSAFSHPQYAFW